MIQLLSAGISVLALCNVALSAGIATHAPRVTLKNGTYEGLYSAQLKQDIFLGIPYAQPPVGDLRFRNPKSLQSKFGGVKKAVAYAASCVGYGVSGSLAAVIH